MTRDTAEQIRETLAYITERLELEREEREAQGQDPFFPAAGMIDQARLLLDRARAQEATDPAWQATTQAIDHLLTWETLTPYAREQLTTAANAVELAQISTQAAKQGAPNK